MRRVLFIEGNNGVNVLMEGKIQDDQAILDNVSKIIEINASKTARAYNYNLDREDLIQHLWLVYLEKLVGSDMRVINRSIENAAIDYGRYQSRRMNTSTDYDTGMRRNAAVAKATGGRGEGSVGSDTAMDALTGKDSKDRIGSDRFAHLDSFSRAKLQEMVTIIENQFGDGSREYFYIVGEIAREGMLDAIRSIMHPLDYKNVAKAVGISGRDSGGNAIAKLMGVNLGDGSYRSAQNNVRNALKKKGYHL